MTKKLIEVDAQAFDDLMYWLNRCAEKGHLENCGDLVDPWAIFDASGWRVVEPTQPADGEPVAWECYEPASEWNGYKGRDYLSREKPKGCSVRAVPLGRIAAPPAAVNGNEKS